MLPLYDMLGQAGNGAAIGQMARHFGLSERQVADAVAALAPAFATGLRRNAAAPLPMAEFLSAIAGGQHRRYFDDVHAAFSPEGIAEGNGILGHIFGSPELSRRIAAHAAETTGIGQEILRQMLPVLATMMMGGFFKQAMDDDRGRAPHAPNAGNVVADILKEMIRYQARGRTDLPEEREERLRSDPFTEMMETMFGTSRAPRRTDEEPPPPPDERSEETTKDIFGPMFEAGREIQAGYQKSMEEVFDQYLKGLQRHRKS